MGKTRTELFLLKDGIDCKIIKVTKKEYKTIKKFVEHLPLFWGRDDRDMYDHFLDGVLQGYLMAYAQTKPARFLGDKKIKIPKRKE